MAEKIEGAEQKTVNEDFPLALPKGTILAGQYVIDDVLGQGGFGITYVATDHKTNEKVAVKEFFPDALAYREMTTVTSYPGERTENFEYGRENFLQEAKTLAEFIGCENIVRIYSYFEENNTAYFVMEYIDGVSFDHYLKEKGGKISFDEASKILVPVMEALAIVHSKGIVHRDVTPDNIYITNDGKVKLLDFGAARYSLGDKSKSLDVILKHGFAPKEQYTRHGKQGPFTDIYSLGATFYFAITGRRPPDSIDRLEEDELIPPSSLGAKLTSYQEDAILRALEVNPQSRFQSMLDFRNVLLNENSAAIPQTTVNQQFFNAPPVTPTVPVQQIPYTTQQVYPQNQVPYTVQQPYPQNQIPYTVQQPYPQNQVPYTAQQPYPQNQIPYTMQQPYPPQQAPYPPQGGQSESVSKQLSESAKQFGSAVAQIGGGVAKQLGNTAKHLGESTAKHLSSAAKQLNSAAQQAGEKAAEFKAKKAAEAEAKKSAGGSAANGIAENTAAIAQQTADPAAKPDEAVNKERPLFRDAASENDIPAEIEDPKKKKIIFIALIILAAVVIVSMIVSFASDKKDSNFIGDPTLINEYFGNIQNGGILTTYSNGTYCCIPYDGHSVICNGEVLLENKSKTYSNLVAKNGGFYYVLDGRIGYYDFEQDKGDYVKELKKFKGDDLQFYLAEDYYFIYVNGKLHRVSKQTNKSEESMDIDPYKFVLCGKYLYYIDKNAKNVSAIFRTSAADFKETTEYNAALKDSSNYFYALTTDGSRICALVKNYDDPNYLDLDVFDMALTNTFFYNIANTINSLAGNEKYSVYGFNCISNYFSISIKNKNGQYNTYFINYTQNGNTKTIKTSPYLYAGGYETYLMYQNDRYVCHYYNREESNKLYYGSINN